MLRHLGSGGMGEVWLAEDTRLHRQAALKMLRPAQDSDASSRAQLMREARAAAALNHPHIATVYDVLEEQGDVVIVFEFVEGETLHARIARGPIPAPEAVEIGIQIAKALAAAHAQGIVHRDLKPANVIIGAGGHVKVLDFGIARMLSIGTTQATGGSAPQTASGFGFIGTPSYAAPEQMVSSAVDERADIYALGVVLFEMISGQRPFRGSDPVQLASSKLGTDAPALSSTGQLVPPALDRIVASLLERDRERRPASASNVLSALRAIYGSKTGTLQPAYSRSLVAIAATLLIVTLGGFGLWTVRNFKPTVTRAIAASPVIAVLPLANMSGDASRDFVAAGIAESLISSLATVPSVTVLSRASVAEARARNKDSAALTKDLGATYLVEGSVQESGGALRVSLNLVKSDRSVAWGDNLEGTFEKIFELQSRLASALTSALVVRVSASERDRTNAQPTTSPEALAAYWQGRTLFEQRDIRANLASAIVAYSRATTLDPSFALAHAALGEAFWNRYVETKDVVWAQKAIDAGFTALRLDANAAEVRYTLAVSLAGTGKLDEAVSEFRHALAIQPNYDDARRELGRVLVDLGRVDEAVAEFDKAIAARPQYWGHYSVKGRALYAAGRYTEAVEALKHAAEVQPDNSIPWQQLGTVYQQMGNKEEAILNYQKALTIRPNPDAYSNIGTLHYQRGEYADAVRAYRQAIELRPNSAPTHRNLGDALARLGDKTHALDAYRQAVTLIEANLRVNPTDALTLASAAIYLEKAGREHEAQAKMAQALTAAPNNNQVLYRAAMLHALTGRKQEALASLKRAIENGYSRAAAAQDDEFASIQRTPEFSTLVAPPGAGVAK